MIHRIGSGWRQRSAGLLVLWLAVCGGAGASKPDVLVIMTDQWSPRYVSWDNPQVRTPNLDSIAREGMVFDACYACSPICMPSRISLITGLYPHDHGHAVWGNVSGYAAPVESVTMFHDIQQAGYTMAQIGKLHWVSGTNWQKYAKTIDEYQHTLGLDTVINGAGPPDSPKEKSAYCQHLKELGLLDAVAKDMHERYIKNEYLPSPSVVKPEDYHDSFTTGQAIEFIHAQPKAKPMCLVVSLHSPHPPLDAPGEFATMYPPQSLNFPPNVPSSFVREKQTIDRAELQRWLANYLGKISLVDYNIGRLVAAMKERGTWDEALVVFTSDHGEMMGAHGFMSKGRFYEESARVPLVMRWPQHIKAGRTKALTQMFDIYPTIVEAIGGELSPGRLAMSQLPVATGKASSVRKLAISEIGTQSPLHLMVRNERYKWFAETKQEYLFDLQNDPFETNNLAALPEHRETAHLMQGELLNYLRSTEVNLSQGYKGKVMRLREAEATGEGATETAKPKKKKKAK